jgi:nitrogen-specific signal transduction histidine kinase
LAVRYKRQQQALLEQAKAAAATAMANKLATHINNPLQTLINIAHLAAEGQSNLNAKTLGQELSSDLQRLSAIVTESLELPGDSPMRN